ncbi:uncharacterized protein LOC117649480 [Thrips palmi]|uniref:Uncharacterized protein LOC117649480 n=1 Tax=Thrips palmi TaxID=161013 RepID=A0A6P8ZSI7_THRPL|nr:uncharacterized protein LOC117649480 [Thrips palmi]
MRIGKTVLLLSSLGRGFYPFISTDDLSRARGSSDAMVRTRHGVKVGDGLLSTTTTTATPSTVARGPGAPSPRPLKRRNSSTDCPSGATVTINEGGCSRVIPVDVIMSRKLRVVLGHCSVGGKPTAVAALPSLETLSLVEGAAARRGLGEGDVGGAAGGDAPPQKPAME